MNKYERQIQLEELYNKNQLIPRIKKEFIDSELGFEQYLLDAGIDVDFGYAVLTQMALHKRCDIPTLLGCVAHVLDDAQASANMLEQCVNADLLDYHEDLDVLIVKYEIADEVQHELDQFQFPLPMVVKPQKLTENSMTGYLDSKGSVILKKNHHEDDVCLDHINRVNRVAYVLNMHIVNFISNKWKNIDKRKPGETLVLFNRRKKAFEKYNNTCSNVFNLLNQETKQFYLTHRYDKRGRVYCMGHHVNYQGNDWNKACIEFAQKELVTYQRQHNFQELMMLKLKIHQFTYSLDIETGNVVANQNSGDKPVTDLPTKLRVYAAYAKQEKLATAYFNGHSYAKVFGYVVNINTGKAVTNPDITSKFKR